MSDRPLWSCVLKSLMKNLRFFLNSNKFGNKVIFINFPQLNDISIFNFENQTFLEELLCLLIPFLIHQ